MGKGLVKCTLGIVLAFALWWAPLNQGVRQPAPALACGFGQPQNMLVNGFPAMTVPSLPTTPANAPQGVVEETFPINTAIPFTEDLSRLPTPINVNVYEWDWNFGDGQTASGYKVSHTYTKAGKYTVLVQLVDPNNSINSDPSFDSAYVTITGQQFTNPPIAQITSSDTYVQVGSSLTYDASGSKSQVGGALTYTWNFDDLTAEVTGAKITHTFLLPGTAFVALIVQDQRGARTVITAPVIVEQQLPKAQLAASASTASIGQAISFDASGSTPTTVSGDAIIKYQWIFGDGITDTTTTPQTTHAYTKAGTYTVKVQAVNKANIPGSATVTVTVTGAGQSTSLFNFGSRTPLVLGGGAVIVFFLLLSIVANMVRTRREEHRRLALEAARMARLQQRRSSRPRPPQSW